MKKSLGRVSLFIFSLVAVAGILFCVPQQYLTVTDERGAVVYLRPVKLGERYTVRFIHSVARRPVDEIYEIAPDCSILRETVYVHGRGRRVSHQGLPSEAPRRDLPHQQGRGGSHAVCRHG